ncbi:hypothetical protein GQ53DRAFT_108243 [Thozetella sp. PMI_491]|nr:hypothetical protein GQ53DRAFT_108243 [Thozetella sp. PMI_491]
MQAEQRRWPKLPLNGSTWPMQDAATVMRRQTEHHSLWFVVELAVAPSRRSPEGIVVWGVLVSALFLKQFFFPSPLSTRLAASENRQGRNG